MMNLMSVEKLSVSLKNQEAIKMANYTVSKDKEGGWNIKKDGADRISGHAQTQSSAEKSAKVFSANSGGGEVRIHNGRFRDSDTVAPGHDPNPPKDKKY